MVLGLNSDAKKQGLVPFEILYQAVESPLHIRNARIREVSPHPRTQKLLPIRRSEDENSKEIFLQPSPTAFEAALAA